MVTGHNAKRVPAGRLKTSTTSPRTGRRERRAAETRVRLFRCALALIAERGLANVTVEDITEAADVGKGTFFNYFRQQGTCTGRDGRDPARESARSCSQRGRWHSAAPHPYCTGWFGVLQKSRAAAPGSLGRSSLRSSASDSVREILKRSMLEGRKDHCGGRSQRPGAWRDQSISQEREGRDAVTANDAGNRAAVVVARETGTLAVDGKQL